MQNAATTTTVVHFECPSCNTHKPLSEYYNRAKDRKCRECIKAARRAKYAECSSTRHRIKFRNRVVLLRKYGLTLEQFTRMIDDQEGRCAVCFVALDFMAPAKDNSSACVDHCHTTGKVRGLLCKRCNLGLGFAQDNPTILRNMAEYLERSQ